MTKFFSYSRALVEFVTSLSAANLPAGVVKQAERRIIDSIGCGLFGSTQPWGDIIASAVLSEQSVASCTLLGRKETAATAPSALVNGSVIHGFELEDIIVEAMIHPRAVVVSAALAAGEYANASGMQLLLGVISGYEAMMRVSLALGAEPAHRGFHMTSVAGPIGATIAAGVILVKVSIGTTRDAVRKNADPAPSDTMSAQYSLPYCTAAAFMGDPKDPAMYFESSISSSVILKLASQVELHVDEQAEAAYPNRICACVQVHLNNGDICTSRISDAHRSPVDPCTDAECEEKFRRLALTAKSSATTHMILEIANQLHRLPHIQPLSETLRN